MINKFLDSWLHATYKENKNTFNYMYIKMFLSGFLLTLIVEPAFVWAYFSHNQFELNFLISYSSNILAALVGIIVLRYSSNFSLAMLCALAYAIPVIYNVYNTGGIYSVRLTWILFFISISFFFMNEFWGISVSIFFILFIVYLYFDDVNKYEHNIQNFLVKNNRFSLLLILNTSITCPTIIFFAYARNTRKLSLQLKTMENQYINDLQREVKLKTEEILSLRNSIAMDFHDIMGNKLASITSISQMLCTKHKENNQDLNIQLTEINILSKQVYDGTKDFIWTLNSKHNNTLDVFSYMRDFAEKLYAPTNIEIDCKILDQEITPQLIEQQKVAQVILILKEAFTNALMHSKAQKVIFSLQSLPQNGFVFSVIDNGCGFDLSNLPRINGLNNMRERAFISDIEIDITSKREYGTSITVTQKYNT
ncbi:MAG: hypothetical protein U0V72_11105 [Cytophagales bacterium]